jgi:hypothetical protein
MEALIVVLLITVIILQIILLNKKPPKLEGCIKKLQMIKRGLDFIIDLKIKQEGIFIF